MSKIVIYFFYSPLILVLLFLFIGCKKQYTPKPRGYMRIDFPAKQYQLFDTAYPYRFEYPVYGRIRPRIDVDAEPYWINVEFPRHNGNIHLSYKKINNNLNQLSEDSRKFAYKHTFKAKSITEIPIANKDANVYGIFYDIKGNTASSVQFYLTDSIKNFFRGALYFAVQPNADSLAPAIHFFKKDIEHLINTFEWKDID